MPLDTHTASRRRLGGALVLASLLSLGACTKTETIVREVPASGAGAPDGAVGNAPDGTPGAEATPGGPVALADPDGVADVPPRAPGGVDPEAVTGDPGAPVDCALTLPCRWSSEDGGFAVTLTSGDDTGPRDGLSLAFRVDTLHDTELAFGGGAEATDGNGVLHTPIVRALGTGNGNAPIGVVAGTGVDGRIDHAAPAGDTHLTRFRLGLLDNGLVREATFENVPLGPRDSVDADCAFTLPCTWTPDDGRTTVELLSAGGLLDLRRLTVGFTVTTSDGAGIVLAGGTALGADGTELASRDHALGTARDHEPLRATTAADIPRAGTVDFRRTASAPTTLRTLTLSLYPDAPVPRWNVVFTDVPLL